MPATVLDLPSPDEIGRRVMFALELVDPVTRGLAADGMTVRAKGLGPPTRTPSGRFVWIDHDPPAARRVRIEATSKTGVFAPLEADIQVPAREPGVVAADLLRSLPLTPTGLYEPPAGLLAVAGMLVDTASGREPLPGARIAIGLREADGDNVLSSYAGVTDARGLFVTIGSGLGDASPMPQPAPAAAGLLVGWLAVTHPSGERRFTPILPIRAGRLTRIPAPLAFADLLGTAPPRPP